MSKPHKIFSIYARLDAEYLNELLGHLRPLEKAGHITLWSDKEIVPGAGWEKEIKNKLLEADIILILVSVSYYNSTYIQKIELKSALERHANGEAIVLPVIIRPCAFHDDPELNHLQALPTDGKAVNDRKHWAERDDAWVDVVGGIKRISEELRMIEQKREQEILEGIKREEQEQERLRREKQQIERAKQEYERKQKEKLIALFGSLTIFVIKPQMTPTVSSILVAE